MSLSTASLLALVLATASPPEARDGDSLRFADERAQVRFAAAMEAWQDEDFPTAAAELTQAQAIEPHDELLYALGRLEQLQGDCNAARTYYLEYLDTGPGPAATADTLVNLEKCKPVEQAPPPPTPLIRNDPPPPHPKAAVDVAGVTLTAVGAAVAIGGAIAFGTSFSAVPKGSDGLVQTAFEQRYARARTQHWSGVGLIASGSALLVGGLVRLLIVRRHDARR